MLGKTMTPRKATAITLAATAILSTALVFALFIINQVAPFGSNSFASMDAKIQYLDYFAYFKDVLAGQNAVDYTLTKGLGGSAFAVFTYYLASPLNLLVALFDKENLIAFFDIVVGIKIVLAAVACAIFLRARFNAEGATTRARGNSGEEPDAQAEGNSGEEPDARVNISRSNATSIIFTTLLSCSYAFCQYMLWQSSNIMWLDGVYMLPLMLLGVYRIVHAKNPLLLILTTALAIIFNWYTGAINCLFAIVWFFVEYALAHKSPAPSAASEATAAPRSNKSHSSSAPARFLKSGTLFGASMLAGVLISCAFLLPTFAVLELGVRASVDITQIFNFRILGNPFSIFECYTTGAGCNQNHVSIYCGCLPALLTIAAFFSKQIAKKTKAIFAVLIIFILATFYFSSFNFLYSLFSNVESYYCRFSYIGVMALIFMAAYYVNHIIRAHHAQPTNREHIMRHTNHEHRTCNVRFHGEVRPILAAGCFLVVAIIVTHTVLHLQNYEYVSNNNVAITCAFIVVVCAILASLALAHSRASSKKHSRKTRAIASALLALVVLISSSDMLENALLLQKDKNVTPAENSEFIAHSKKYQSIVKALKNAKDNNLFRISQTEFRATNASTGLSAAYNDPLAYNFQSIPTYTSSPQETERSFLDSVGYGKLGGNLNIVKDSIISTDALLGSKYLVTKRDYACLASTSEAAEKADSLANISDTYVFENPYAFPLAFTYNKNSAYSKAGSSKNTFDVQNEIFSEIAGSNVAVFEDLEASVENSVNTNENTATATVSVNVPEGNYAVYAYAKIGNRPDGQKARISFSDGVEYGYQCWLAPTVFYVPTDSAQGASDAGAAEKSNTSAQVAADENKATFTITQPGLSEEIELSSLRVCALDLDALQDVSNIANAHAAQLTQVSDSHFRIETENAEATNVLFSVPYDENWEVTVNGACVQAEKYGEGLMSIPVPAGSVQIEMQYRVPGLKTGAVCTLAGVALAAAIVFITRRNNHKLQN